jgi:glycosyltransferase involved in cell wall biosynthesis
MPAYNAEKFIAEAIEFILGQTFTDFEFIINDRSEDKTAEIIRAYEDPRIVFIDHEKTGDWLPS